MEDIPPSYYQSVNPSVLDLIAPYLDTPALHSLALVSEAYNETFMPHLWGSPASHFVPVTSPASPGYQRALKGGTSYDDMVYVALTRFKKILKIARESTRCLTHTLYLPAANAEIYSGPNATWLREILDGLPNLQSLCVSGLPFFDHHSLVAVNKNRVPQPWQFHQTYSVKLLLASKESNTTSIGLSLFLPYLSRLVYLDLSYTTPAKDINVLYALSTLADLQVLKLRGIGLRDTEAEALANAIGLRVRLLDLSDNLLGDAAIRSLLQACFLHPTDDTKSRDRVDSHRYPAQQDYHSRRHLESWPVGLPPAPDFLSLDTLRSADLDRNLLVQLTNPLTGRLAFEDIPHGGLTHLYITGNPAVTVEGVKGLLKLGRLHVLDAGDISGETPVDKYVRSVRDTGKWQGRTRSIGSGGTSVPASQFSGDHAGVDTDEWTLPDDDDFHFPGAEKLIPVLKEKASKNLTYLRIEHSIITSAFDLTKEPQNKLRDKVELTGSSVMPSELNSQANVAEVAGSKHHAVEVAGSRYQPAEMPSDPHVFELDATPVIRAELPGDLIHFAISPPIGDKPELDMIDDAFLSPVRGGGAFAPEVVQTRHDKEKEGNTARTDAVVQSISPITTPTRATSIANGSTVNGITEARNTEIVRQTLPTMPDHASQIERLVRGRPSHLSPALHPSSLPNLRTLLLTNLPDQVAGPTSPLLISIKAFVAACAAEAFIAILKAKTNYSLPPGRARAAAERKHAQSLFALRTIVLEVSPTQEITTRQWKHTRQRLNISKSSTGDHDSEALWSAAENDFSFFGEEGEEHDECGIYDYEPGKYFPSVYLDDKLPVTPEDPSTVQTQAATNTFNFKSATGTIFRSPRELPLGRNRRSSDEFRSRQSISSPNRPGFATEMVGSTPTSQPRSQPGPTSTPQMPIEPVAQMTDLVGELSKWRKERKIAYEEEVRRRSRRSGVTVTSSRLADTEVYVEGHWKGEIKVVRNAKPMGSGISRGQGRLERTGKVDVYGNYFEKDYLYS